MLENMEKNQNEPSERSYISTFKRVNEQLKMNEESSKYFSNSKEELEFYRNTYKLKVEELLSCQTKIKALENINNKLKEKMSKKSDFLSKKDLTSSKKFL